MIVELLAESRELEIRAAERTIAHRRAWQAFAKLDRLERAVRTARAQLSLQLREA